MNARATVIIPTFGNAPFARWAIESVRRQTVKDIEICIICDGSPEHIVSSFRDVAKQDLRVRVFVFPKSPRTGEPYRDIVIRQSTGQIVCYCSHDDLWLPNHVQEMERTLKRQSFTHSINAYVALPQDIGNAETIFGGIYWIDLKSQEIVDKMLGGQNFFGLTFGAHTRESYDKLKEGWVTTPRKDMPTDLYMWQKFLSTFGNRCRTTRRITALNFRKFDRETWSEEQRADELAHYFECIQDPAFLRTIQVLASHSCPFFWERTRMKWRAGTKRLLARL